MFVILSNAMPYTKSLRDTDADMHLHITFEKMITSSRDVRVCRHQRASILNMLQGSTLQKDHYVSRVAIALELPS
jgi:hypothetical protein